VFKNSEIEYKYQKYARIFLYQNVAHPIPPPFNLVIVLPQLIAHWCERSMSTAMKGLRVPSTDVSMNESGDGAALHKEDSSASAAYMPRYLRVKEEDEATSSIGMSKATRDAAQRLEAEQHTHAKLLLEVQKKLQPEQQSVSKLAESVDKLHAAVALMREDFSDVKSKVAALTETLQPEAPPPSRKKSLLSPRGGTSSFPRIPAKAEQ